MGPEVFGDVRLCEVGTLVDAFEVPFCARAGSGSSFTRDYVHKWEAMLLWRCGVHEKRFKVFGIDCFQVLQ